MRHLETPDASEGQIAFDTIGALGQDAVEHARIYVWPLEKRLRAADGRHGSLHAKVALANGRSMLVSNANLTEYAMTLNMEMGLLLHGGTFAGTGRQTPGAAHPARSIPDFRQTIVRSGGALRSS